LEFLRPVGLRSAGRNAWRKACINNEKKNALNFIRNQESIEISNLKSKNGYLVYVS